MNLDDKMNCMYDMMKNLGTVSHSVDSLTRNMYFTYAKLEVNEARLRLLEYKSLDIETRLLKNNLIFTGFPEANGAENCLELVHSLLADHLQIDTSVIKASNAYRLGRRVVARTGQTPRNRAILASFSDPSLTDEILRSARMLAGTTFGISRDYPREIRDARKDLWEDFKRAKSLYGKRNVQLQFPAALVINGDKVRDLFPGWRSILQGSRNSNVKARVDEKFKHAIEEVNQTPTVVDVNMAEESDEETTDTNDESGDSTAAAQGGQGAQGAQGPQGPQGPQENRPDPNTLTPRPGYLLSVHGPIQRANEGRSLDPSATDQNHVTTRDVIDANDASAADVVEDAPV